MEGRYKINISCQMFILRQSCRYKRDKSLGRFVRNQSRTPSLAYESLGEHGNAELTFYNESYVHVLQTYLEVIVFRLDAQLRR